jgi:hypothetical protein
VAGEQRDPHCFASATVVLSSIGPYWCLALLCAPTAAALARRLSAPFLVVCGWHWVVFGWHLVVFWFYLDVFGWYLAGIGWSWVVLGCFWVVLGCIGPYFDHRQQLVPECECAPILILVSKRGWVGSGLDW